MDVSIVGLWLLNAAVGLYIAVNPLLLRTMRIARLFRLLRLAKTIHMLDVMRFLIVALRGCSTVLMGSSFILFLFMMTMALTLHYFTIDTMLSEEAMPAARKDLFIYFGTFS